jgi:hypothetical protein
MEPVSAKATTAKDQGYDQLKITAFQFAPAG